MPRNSRYQFPGATFHVMLRGNAGDRLFFNDQDRKKMCLILQEGVERYGHRVLSFCFMTNHIHLAIQLGQIDLSCIIQNLAFRYSRHINWHEERVGHLFQGRFKSILIDSRRYLKSLVRYIHLNPVRAGIVNRPEHYQWSSHNAYLGNDQINWVTPNYLLSRFSDSLQSARQEYQKFVLAGIGVQEQIDFTNGTQDGILGDDTFIEMIMKSQQQMPEMTIDLPEVVSILCDFFQTDLTTLRDSSKERTASNVRSIIALLIRESGDFTLEELGRFICRDPNNLSKQASRLSQKSLHSEKLKQEIADAKAYLFQMSELLNQ